MTATASLDFSFADVNDLHDRKFFPAVDRIREEDPVFWSNNQHCWLLTLHEDVVNAFSDPRWSAKRLQMRQFASIPEDQYETLIPHLSRYVPEWVNNIDSPQHDRVRRLLLKSFSRKVIDGLRPAVDRACDELIAKALDKREFDYVEDIAFPLPARVIVSLLGVPESCVSRLREWANNVTAALAGFNPPQSTVLAAERSMQEMDTMFLEAIEEKKRNPQPDLLTALVQARDDNDALSTEELLGICQLVIIAGHDSTANSIGLGLIAMLENPGQAALYKEGKVDGQAAMSELLRHVSVASTQPRVAHERMELRGKTIEPGQFAFLTIAAANRDPRVFTNPTQMDFTRKNVDRIAVFGPGTHHCVGHYLARLELDSLYRKLFERVAKIERRSDEIRFQLNVVFRGIESLPVRFTPR